MTIPLMVPSTDRSKVRRLHLLIVIGAIAFPFATPDFVAPGVKDKIDSWRTGTKGKLKARFVAVRVRVGDGPPQRIRDKGQQHLPGEEDRASGEKKYYLANLPAKADLRTATIKAQNSVSITLMADPGGACIVMRS